MNGGVVHAVENLTRAEADRAAGGFARLGFVNAATAVRQAYQVVESNYSETPENDCLEQTSDDLYYAEIPTDGIIDERIAQVTGITNAFDSHQSGWAPNYKVDEAPPLAVVGNEDDATLCARYRLRAAAY
jgi:hypothetical protein